MFFHLVLTTECNLQCKYCFGETLDDFDEDFSGLEIEYSLPKKANYGLKVLADFCGKDPNCVLTFYGGEPFLCTDEIKKIMDLVKSKHFMVQTNGLLLDKLDSNYVNRFHTILVSLDGDEALTDFYRGNGTFRKVVENLKMIIRNGFEGELIARMTVMEQTDIYKQVTWLLENSEFTFRSVHWQLNAGFWGSDYLRRDFKRWSEMIYSPGVARLARFWVDQMEKKGVVYKLYPLLGIANSLLSREKSLLRCGGGWVNYTIQTDGNIIPCPTMWGIKDYYLGHVRDANPLGLRKLFVKRPCTDCDVLEVCGGRCLYANITRRWKDEQYAAVCNTVRELIKAVDTELPRIKSLIKKGVVSQKNFEFIKYNGCEIIP
uniref:Radical SAM domain protein n=1 Tax=uncultured crenarchaeote MCG TaxID=529375 RepID=B2YI72_9CREN|nr:radical SAM domain protein [uncultured crenarchaeote MCG]